ncbi:carbohydrate ABC transporter permease [Virgibacillus ndiopensis]|uniref:carbohydrate ABC transporter permease n=1 Tax=Virgibacillus ndiopensis TaxID=2004408 RepID=UPI001C3F2C25|nr:carbohydrate ABC transporter permease [Virgibacillus ndiopensis]
MIKRKHSSLWYSAMAIIVILTLLWTLFPIYWMLVTSLKRDMDVFDAIPTLWPEGLNIQSYIELINGENPIYGYFINSVITSLGTVVIAIIVATLAGYALSRLRFRFRKSILMSVLVTQMFPLVVLLIPIYLLFVQTNLLNTYLGLILGFTSFTIPFGIWMIKGFVDSIPIEIEEAAMIDGCSRFQIMKKIVIPLIVPGIVTTGIFAFMDAWNNLLFPLTLINDVGMKTLPPGMILSFAGQFKHDWSGMMAASTIVCIPVVMVFIFLQRYLVEGLTGGSVKG